jgi:hypothetical protein
VDSLGWGCVSRWDQTGDKLMWTWLLVLALILAFIFWVVWMLHKRTPPRPGEKEYYRQDDKQGYYGSGGVG